MDIERLAILSNTLLYSVLSKDSVTLTRDILYDLTIRKGLANYNTKPTDSRRCLMDNLLFKLSVRIYNEVVNPSGDENKIHLTALKEKSMDFKLDFVQNYGRYMPDCVLSELFQSDFGLVKAYKEYLIDDYLTAGASQNSENYKQEG